MAKAFLTLTQWVAQGGTSTSACWHARRRNLPGGLHWTPGTTNCRASPTTHLPTSKGPSVTRAKVEEVPSPSCSNHSLNLGRRGGGVGGEGVGEERVEGGEEGGKVEGSLRPVEHGGEGVGGIHGLLGVRVRVMKPG